MKLLWGYGAKARGAGFALVVLSSSAWSMQVSAGTNAQILYFEPLRIAVPKGEAAHQKTRAGSLNKFEFTAFGRQYALSVQADHSLRMAHHEKTNASALQLYHGSIDGLKASWVRLATQGTDVHGMVWDGVDLYVIAPAEEVRDQLLPPLQATGNTVIFRLIDALIPAQQAACATVYDPPMQRASDAYATLLKATSQSDSPSIATGMHLEVSAVADAHYLERYASAEEAHAGILVRMNNVDGIFSAQLGVHIKVPTVHVHSASTDPLSSETKPTALLEELAALRRRTPELRSSGLTHLFTGRDLDGTSIGIGYLDALCDTKYGAALTEVGLRGAWYESLIAAHEIAHNFGAVHDGEPDKACASTPQGLFLMSPNVNAVDRFSQCSQELMRPKVASAVCIAPVPPPDVAIGPDLGVLRPEKGTPFSWKLPITNVGGASAMNVRVEIHLPPTFVAEQAWIEGGSCTHGGGIIQCEIQELSAGGSETVELRLRSDAVGSNLVSATVYAENEQDTQNNEGSGTIQIDARTQSVAVEIPVASTAPTPAPTAAGGGGGGAFGAVLLAALSFLGLWRRARA